MGEKERHKEGREEEMSAFARRKKYAWIVLASGVGGTLVFLVLCALDGPPDIFEYIWPICTSAAALIATLLLKKYYREEPETFAGLWQLSIVDLFAISFFAAVLMAGWRAAWPLAFVPAGIAVTLSLAAAFAFCLLFAARKGFQLPQAKITQALSVLMTSLGWTAVGTLVVLIAVILCYSVPHELAGFLAAIFVYMDPWQSKNNWLVYSIRIGVICLPLGYIFGAISHFLVSPRK